MTVVLQYLKNKVCLVKALPSFLPRSLFMLPTLLLLPVWSAQTGASSTLASQQMARTYHEAALMPYRRISVGGLTVKWSVNGHLAPPGHSMVFIVNGRWCSIGCFDREYPLICFL